MANRFDTCFFDLSGFSSGFDDEKEERYPVKTYMPKEDDDDSN